MQVGRLVKMAVKYGPQAKIAWDNGGKAAAETGRRRVMSTFERRKAFAEAQTLRDGSVLRLVRKGMPTYVVYAGDEPRSTYPDHEGPLSELVADADLEQRVTPEQEQARHSEAGHRRNPFHRSRKAAHPDDAETAEADSTEAQAHPS